MLGALLPRLSISWYSSGTFPSRWCPRRTLKVFSPQVVALITYVLAYFPGGTQTLRFGGQIALRGAGNLLPF